MNICKDKLSFPELSFKEEGHIYTLEGKIIPSVSEVMRPLSDAVYGNINSYVLSSAARRGTSVHQSIENYIEFDIEDVEPNCRGYVNAFKDFEYDFKPNPVGTEVRIYHKLLRYAGTLDLLCEIGDELVLIDYKTTAQVRDWIVGMQLEAYSQALRSHGVIVDKKMILHLKDNGEYNIISYKGEDPDRWRVFGSLLTVHQYIQRYA